MGPGERVEDARGGGKEENKKKEDVTWNGEDPFS